MDKAFARWTFWKPLWTGNKEHKAWMVLAIAGWLSVLYTEGPSGAYSELGLTIFVGPARFMFSVAELRR